MEMLHTYNSHCELIELHDKMQQFHESSIINNSQTCVDQPMIHQANGFDALRSAQLTDESPGCNNTNILLQVSAPVKRNSNQHYISPQILQVPEISKESDTNCEITSTNTSRQVDPTLHDLSVVQSTADGRLTSDTTKPESAQNEMTKTNVVKSPQKKLHVCTFEGCTAKFNRPGRLEQHLVAHYGVKQFQCLHPGCDKAYLYKSHLQRHIKSCHEVKLVRKSYKCSYPGCEKVIRHAGNVKRHMDRSHKQKQLQFSCEFCDKAFSKKKQLNVHLYEHVQIAPYKCETCNMGFLRHAMFVRHQRTHTRYKCDVPECQVVCLRWFELLKHRRLFHKQTYNCAHCKYKTVNRTSLVHHMQSHIEAELTFPCPYTECHRIYQHKRNLQNHIRRFHENLLIPCPHPHCNKSFSCRAKMRLHLKVHDPDYICERKKLEGKERKKRKDVGVPKRSYAVKLSEAVVSLQREKEILAESNASALLDCNETCSKIENTPMFVNFENEDSGIPDS